MEESNFLQINNELQEKLHKIEDLRGEIQSYYNLPTLEINKVRKKYFTQSLYHSYLDNQSDFTLNELEQLVFFDKVTGHLPFSEYQRLYRKIKTLNFLETEANNSSKSLSIQLIQKVYLMLFWEEEIIQDGFYKLPYRDTITLLEDNESSMTLVPVSDIAFQLEKLVDESKNIECHKAPLLYAMRFQQRFLEIRPFEEGNDEVSFFLFQFLVMNEGLPPLIFRSSIKDRYINGLKAEGEDGYHFVCNLVHEECILSLNHLLGLFKQVKNKTQISQVGYLSTIIKDIQVNEKEITRYKVLEKVDEQEVRHFINFFQYLIKHYFIENPFENLDISHKRIHLKDMMKSHLFTIFLNENKIFPLWEKSLIEGENEFIYLDTCPTVLEIEMISPHIYVPNSLLYFGVLPCKDSNYLFSIQISSYLDFKQKERYPQNLSFFRNVKGGVQFLDWEEKDILFFFDQCMKEFFDQMSDKINERKRILKKIIK